MTNTLSERYGDVDAENAMSKAIGTAIMGCAGPDGMVSAREVVWACTVIMGGYIKAIPEEARMKIATEALQMLMIATKFQVSPQTDTIQ